MARVGPQPAPGGEAARRGGRNDLMGGSGAEQALDSPKRATRSASGVVHA